MFPSGNMILLSLGLSYAETVDASHVFTGLQATDQYNYWDTTQAFLDSVNDVAVLNRTHKIKLAAPFADLTKADELNLTKHFNTPFKSEFTLTCYNPSDGKSCGKCPSCSERIKAFKVVGLKDEIEYV
jgi:7-cyano-7-deazaguanine synthase